MLSEQLPLSSDSDCKNNEDNAQTKRICNRTSTAELKLWLHEHPTNPYPTKTEKIHLAKTANLTLTQVSTWFANARRRLKKEPPHPMCTSDWLTAASLCYCNGITAYQTPFDSYIYSQSLQYLLYNSRLFSFATNGNIRSYNVPCNIPKSPDVREVGQTREDEGRKRAAENISDDNADGTKKKKKIWSVDDMLGVVA